MYLVDYEDDKLIVEIKRSVSALRDVQAGLAQLAQALVERPGKIALLVLPDCRLSEMSVRDQLQRLVPALRQDLTERLKVVFASSDPDATRPPELPPSVWEELVRPTALTGVRPVQLPRPSMQSEVLRLLLQQRYAGSGSLTAAWLSGNAGCSYRTVSATLHSLGSAIIRTRDRRVKLAYFPEEAWRRVLVGAVAARATVHYSDQSGQPRSAEYLAHKVQQLGREDVAIGGVFGARHHLPALDLVSAPRLDVCVHAPLARVEPLPIAQMDPGLVARHDDQAPVRLAVHYLRRRTSFFVADGHDVRFADPVECLLDLHDARLDHQAQQLLDQLESQWSRVARHGQ